MRSKNETFNPDKTDSDLYESVYQEASVNVSHLLDEVRELYVCLKKLRVSIETSSRYAHGRRIKRISGKKRQQYLLYLANLEKQLPKISARVRDLIL